MKMSNSFMSQLPTFTLESLVTNGQWTAAQPGSRKKTAAKPGAEKKSDAQNARSGQQLKTSI
jgi:hypothetical protein